MSFVVDTSVWIDFFNGSSNEEINILESKIGTEQIIVGDLIMMEILQGIRNDKLFLECQSYLEEYLIVSMMAPDACIGYANIYRTLRKKGVTIRSTIDVIIAGYCIKHNLPLLQRDQDFIPFQQHLGLILL